VAAGTFDFFSTSKLRFGDNLVRLAVSLLYGFWLYVAVLEFIRANEDKLASMRRQAAP
jgi:hypothetical protein